MRTRWSGRAANLTYFNLPQKVDQNQATKQPGCFLLFTILFLYSLIFLSHIGESRKRGVCLVAWLHFLQIFH